MRQLRLLFLCTIFFGSTPALGNGTFQIGLAGSALYGGLPTGALEADYNFNPMFSVGLLLGNGGLDISSTIQDVIDEQDDDISVDIEDALIARSVAMLTAKFYPFLGSFNIGVATGSGVTVGKLKVSSDDVSEVIDETYTYQQTLGAITIGNSWRWTNFYVGFDWVGYMGVLSSSKEVESESTTLANAAFGKAFKEFENLTDVFGEKGGPIAFMLKIGTGF